MVLDMARKWLVFVSISLAGGVILSACNLPSYQVAETMPSDDVITSVAQTILAGEVETQQAALTQAAPPANNNLVSPVAETAVSVDTAVPTESVPSETPTPTETEMPTLSPTPTASSTPTIPPGAFLEDHFTNSNGWYKYEGDNYGFKYVGETYHIYNKILNAAIWSVRDDNYHNIRIDVDVKRVDGPEDGYFGVVCRFKDDGDNYYALVIGDDGFYGIGQMKDGEFGFLKKGSDDQGIIKRGKNSINRVSGVCKGNKLTLFANGKKLVEVFDDAFANGDIGLVVGNKIHQAGIEAAFDNFALYVP